MKTLVLTAALAVLGLLAAGTSGATTAAACAPRTLDYRVTRVDGAAGTFLIHLSVRPKQPCVLDGYPLLRLVGRGGPLPTSVHHGGLPVLDRDARPVRATPARPARLLVAYNDVPSGARRCPTGVALLVAGERVAVTTRACRSKLLESPYVR